MNGTRKPDQIHVDQRTYGIAEWSQHDPFYYDLAYPRDDTGTMALEIDDICDELMRDDVYGLGVGTGPGDVWVDCGSHVGLFAIAAMQAGAEVACVIDMDPELAWCAMRNAGAFADQSALRGKHDTFSVIPTVICEKITSARQLAEAAMLPAHNWERRRRSCLKLDVQGSESEIFDGTGLYDLAEIFDYMVFEWHQTETDHLLPVMEAMGWRVTRVTKHVDILLNSPTSIICAFAG